MSGSPQTMRAFVALTLDELSLRALFAVARQVRDGHDLREARWVPASKMHVTLKFLGSVDLALAPALIDVLEPFACTEPPALGVAALGAFPDIHRARILIAKVGDPDGGVGDLARRVEDASARLGFARETREFRPHVTLARMRDPVDVRPWIEGVHIDVPKVRVTEIVLFRSDLSATNTEYVPVARFAFQAAPLG
jgi:2'-5' RNA ligase